MKMLTLALIFSFSLFAGTSLETDSFAIVKKTIDQKVKKYGKKNVLVVLDIDNTILKTTQNLGSDQWFGWQYSHCINQEKAKDFCTTTDFDQLLRLQGLLFAIIPTKPTDDHAVKVIKEVQAAGIRVIALTARGSDFRNSTLISLRDNDIDFTKTPLGTKEGFASTYIPYDLKALGKSGLTKEDMRKVGNKKARPVSYMDGVYMTSGLHKGIMLKTLIKKTGSNAKAIIFVDDHEKHTKGMQLIYGDDKRYDLTTFRYSKIDPTVKAFHESDKKDVIRSFKVLQATLKELFGTF